MGLRLAAFIGAFFATGPALADPTGGILANLIITILASNTFTISLAASTFAVQAISALVTAGLYTGASLLLQNTRKADLKSPDRSQDSLQLSDAPMFVILGRAPVAGNILFGNASLSGASVLLHRHRACCAGPISGFEEFYLGRREVLLANSGAVTSPPYWRSEALGSWAYIFTRNGLDTETVFAPLIDTYPELIGVDHRGDNLAQTLSVFEAPEEAEYLKVFPNGKPDTQVLVRGKLPFDPRTGLYAWTDNGPLNVLHFLTMPAYLGWGMDIDLFDLDDISSTADMADTLIGGEPRSRCGGIYSCDRPRGEILADLLLSTGVQVVHLTSGKYSLRLIEDNPASQVTIPLKDVSEFEWAGVESVSRPNRMVVKYFPEAHDYKTTALDMSSLRWGYDETEAVRVGDRVDEIALNFCQWPGQASRIGRQLWFKRRANRGQVITNLTGMMALGRTCMTVPFVGIGSDIKIIPVEPRLEEDGVSVSIPFAEVPVIPEFNQALDQAPDPDPFPDGSANGNIVDPEIPSVYAQVIYPGDGTGELRLQVTSDTPYLLEVAYRTYGDGLPTQWMAFETFEGTDCAYVYPLNLEGERVDFKLRQYDPETSETSNFVGFSVPVMMIDNTAPEIPDTTGSSVRGHEYHVAYVGGEVRYKHEPAAYGPWQAGTNATIRPNQLVGIIYPPPSPPLLPGDRTEYRVTAYTSNGTAGTPFTLEVIS